ncbi:MAG TPA: sigma-70 family RNA polymerase sigma factor [Bryobacteraceae bacterium]|nr:sigma-70 family RNA polymerase sigma factor [Bryobacteraceae bacterium]
MSLPDLSGATANLRAFELEALPYLPDIYRTARRAVGDSTGAEDVTQEVFLQAWKTFHRFQPGTNCKAWLMTILFYACHEHRRQLRRHQAFDWRPEYDDLIATPPTQPSCLNAVLQRGLRTLPGPYRAVLILAEVYQYSYREIAAMLRIPVGTVMSRLSRAKKQLRSRFSEMREAA